ncbi:hypothetical protein A0H81_07706 [Grifola frondosa]|uniref:Uncharacterized protein n=1 Tax=Grifola frondosa TaxID=5627 RepID=A0A1C7M814_GRIFR|nr:hypothetical protein A0H81_07706 [Grifola frondosa]
MRISLPGNKVLNSPQTVRRVPTNMLPPSAPEEGMNAGRGAFATAKLGRDTAEAREEQVHRLDQVYFGGPRGRRSRTAKYLSIDSTPRDKQHGCTGVLVPLANFGPVSARGDHHRKWSSRMQREIE